MGYLAVDKRAAAVSGTVAVVATVLLAGVHVADASVYLTAAGANITEFYIDILPPGSDAAGNDWRLLGEMHLSGKTAFPTLGTVKSERAGSAYLSAGESMWFQLNPLPVCDGVRFRAKASGAGTLDVRVGTDRPGAKGS